MRHRRSRPVRLPEAVARLALGGALAIVRIGKTNIVIRDDGRPFDRLRTRETLVTALTELQTRKELSQ